ncbi:MAG: MFS transporter [Dehalococcoidia bacterium]|nr:MFS transporter [Dehalococcoidia bacterium]
MALREGPRGEHWLAAGMYNPWASQPESWQGHFQRMQPHQPAPIPPATRPARDDGRLLAALRHSDFRVLWLSTALNQIGHGMQPVMLGWLVLDLTGSGGMVGVVFAMRALPNLVVGLAAGSVTDRLDRRLIIRLSSVGLTLVGTTIGALLLTDHLTVWQLMLFTFVLGAMHAFETTARQVYAYDIVGATGALNGIALMSLAQRAGGVLGAMLAGGVLAWWEPGPAFLLMAASNGGAAIVQVWLRRPGASAPRVRESLSQNVLNYWRALRTNRTMLCLMISTAAAEVFGFSHQVMLPVLARDVLHVGPGGLGLLTACRSVGGAIGVLALGRFSAVRRQGILLLSTVVLLGLGQVLLAQAPTFVIALLFVILVNIAGSATDVLHQALLQQTVSNEQRGRAMGSWIVGIGTAPLGHMEAGYLADLASPRISLMVNGLALAAVGGVMWVVLPRLRRL